MKLGRTATRLRAVLEWGVLIITWGWLGGDQSGEVTGTEKTTKVQAGAGEGLAESNCNDTGQESVDGQRANDVCSTRPGLFESSRKRKRRKRAKEEKTEPVRSWQEELRFAGVVAEALEGRRRGDSRHWSPGTRLRELCAHKLHLEPWDGKSLVIFRGRVSVNSGEHHPILRLRSDW